MITNSLLPMGSTLLEKRAAECLQQAVSNPILIADLINPERCPERLLPYLAWALSVDKWDENWSDEAKRIAIKNAFLIHKQKGTITALRRVVEPIGYIVELKEWWQETPQGIPGTFKLTIEVSETGLNAQTNQELTRLIDDVKPYFSSFNTGNVGNPNGNDASLFCYPNRRNDQCLSLTTEVIMAKNYYSLLTHYGAQLFAQALANQQPVRITHFAVGDGNGKAVEPNASRTALVRQVHKATVSAISSDPRNTKQVIFELTLPENIGGFWIREMGIYDANNRLVAYANCPDTYKPQLSEGSGKIQIIRMILLVSSSNAVTLTVDDSIIFATRGQLNPLTITANSRNSVDNTGHTHEIASASTLQKGLVQLTNDTGLDSESLALTAKAGKALAQQNAQNALAINGKVGITNNEQITGEKTFSRQLKALGAFVFHVLQPMEMQDIMLIFMPMRIQFGLHLKGKPSVGTMMDAFRLTIKSFTVNFINRVLPIFCKSRPPLMAMPPVLMACRIFKVHQVGQP